MRCTHYRLGMQVRWSWRRSVAALALGGAVLGVGAQAAYAHAALEGSDPAPGAIVATPPAAVTLTFNEPVEAKLGAVKVYDTNEQRVDDGRVTTSGRVVRAPLRSDAMRNGTYVVVWRVQSTDGHAIQAAYTFSVGTPSVSTDTSNSLAAKYLSANGASTAISVFVAVGRTLAFSGLALFLGAALAGAWWARSLLASRALTRAVWAGIILTVTGTTIALLGQGAYVAGLGFAQVFRLDLLGDVLQTRYGRALLARVVLALLALVWWRWLRRSDASRGAVIAGGVLTLGFALTVSFAGHAATGPLPVLGVALDVVHVLAVSAWFGGLVVLAYAVLVDEPVAWSAVQRFSTLALVSVVCIVLSGAGQGWRQLGSLNALTETTYGNVLLAKVAVFLCVLPFAAYARDLLRRRVTPEERAAAAGDAEALADLEGGLDAVVVRTRLRRSVAIEIVFLVAVFALTALLVNAVPGREVTSGAAYIHLDDAQVRVEGALAPARLGPNDVHLTAYTPDGLPLDVQGMTAAITRPDVGQIAIPLRRLSPGHYYSPQFVIPRKGFWTLVVKTNVDAFTQDVQDQQVKIR